MVEILKEYINKRLELLKLNTAEKSSKAMGFFLFFVVIFIFGSFFILMLNIAIGLLIGHLLGNYGIGLLIMSLFYLILTIVAFVYRKKFTDQVAGEVLKFLND